MELNGVANIQMMIQSFKEMKKEDLDNSTVAFLDRLDYQAKVLERYMLACNDVIKNSQRSEDIPSWSEVRDVPENFPNMKERFTKVCPHG